MEIKDMKLREMLKQLEESDHDLYSLLTIEQEEILENKNIEKALYHLTDNDQITSTGTFENVELPYYAHQNHSDVYKELYDLLYLCKLNVRISDTYILSKLKNHFVIADICSGAEWEMLGAEVLTHLYNIDFDEATKLENELYLESYYTLENLQLEYYYDFDDVKNHILENDYLYEDRERICEMIGELINYDQGAYKKFFSDVL